MSDSLKTIMARLAVINAAITGVKRAGTYPPQRGPSAADMPYMFSRWVDSRESFIVGMSYSKAFWRVELVVLVKAAAQGNMDEHMDELVLWPERIRDAYAARVNLAATSGGAPLLAGAASIESIGPCRNEPMTIGDTTYSAVHCELVVKDHTDVTVKA